MKSLAKGLSSILDRSRIKTEIEDRLAYNSDATHYFATGTPDAVVLPRTAAEVSGIIKYAAANQIPVTPRGAGSGLSGGCTPIMVMGSGHSNILKNQKKASKTTSIWVLIDQFSCENWPIKDD